MGKCYPVAHPTDIPSLEGYNPVQNYMNWDVILVTDRDESEIQREKRAGAHTSTIRVTSEKLDKLVNLMGELVTLQANLTQRAEENDTGESPLTAEDTPSYIRKPGETYLQPARKRHEHEDGAHRQHLREAQAPLARPRARTQARGSIQFPGRRDATGPERDGKTLGPPDAYHQKLHGPRYRGSRGKGIHEKTPPRHHNLAQGTPGPR